MDNYTRQWLNQYSGRLALLGFIDAKVFPSLQLKLNYVVGNAPDYDPNRQIAIRINNQAVTLCTHNADMRSVHGQMLLK